MKLGHVFPHPLVLPTPRVYNIACVLACLYSEPQASVTLKRPASAPLPNVAKKPAGRVAKKPSGKTVEVESSEDGRDEDENEEEEEEDKERNEEELDEEEAGKRERNKSVAFVGKLQTMPDEVQTEWARLAGLPAGSGKRGLQSRLVNQLMAKSGKSWKIDENAAVIEDCALR